MSTASEDFDIHKYEWSFIESPAEDYFCALCTKILEDPMLTECCGIHFCKACISEWSSEKVLAECPSCKTASVTCILNKGKCRNILELEVECPFKEHGCQWTGNIRGNHDHMQLDCQYVDCECDNGCGQNVMRHEIQDHLKNFCSKRTFACEHCNLVGNFEFIVEQHVLECPNMPIICPAGCGKEFIRSQHEQHYEECPELEIACPYVGCDVIVKRKLMPGHLSETIQRHSHLLAISANELFDKSKYKFQQQIEVNHRLTEYYRELRSVSAASIREKHDQVQEHIVSESKQELEKRMKKINWKVREHETRLNTLHEHLEHIVKTAFAKLPNMLWEINRTRLNFRTRLSNGQFTQVWTGGSKYRELQVAIKKLKPGSMTSSKFLQEAHLLQQLEHCNIIQLFGVSSTEEPTFIVLELMSSGNLYDYIKHSEANQHTNDGILQDITYGMAYLEELNCIHRSLTGQSILMQGMPQHPKCKIGGFSLARILDKDETEYIIPQGERVPVKWSAPEVLIYNKCSIKSDVWSFGIVQYEVVTHKELKMPITEAKSFILLGKFFDCCQRLIDKKSYDKIALCLNSLPRRRPTFQEILT